MSKTRRTRARTLRVPPYRSVRLRVPIRLRVDHEWEAQLGDPRLAKKMALLFGDSGALTAAQTAAQRAASNSRLVGSPSRRTSAAPPPPAPPKADSSADRLTLAQRARVLLGARHGPRPPTTPRDDGGLPPASNTRGSVSADI